MKSEGYEALKGFFLAARDLPIDERTAYLDGACPDDATLRADVQRLLAAHDTGSGILMTGEFDAGSSAGIDPKTLFGGLDEQGRPQHDAPESIGRYRILGVLGEGGMGVVYEAEQESPLRKVALKVIRPGMTSKQMLRRFEYEAQVLGRLQHPGIAQIFEAGAGRSPAVRRWGVAEGRISERTHPLALELQHAREGRIQLRDHGYLPGQGDLDHGRTDAHRGRRRTAPRDADRAQAPRPERQRPQRCQDRDPRGGVRKVDDWTGRYSRKVVEFAADPIDPFFNVNRPQDLAQAETILAG